MFQFSAAYGIARRSNSKLLLDDSFYWKNAKSREVTPREYMLDIFCIEKSKVPVEKCACKILPSGRVSRGLFRIIASTLVPWWYVPERTYNFNGKMLALRSPVYLDGYWQSPKYFVGAEHELRAIFKIKETLSPQLLGVARELETDESCVAVSVRRGDYVTNQNAAKLHGALGVDYYLNAMKQVRGLVKKPKFKIFSDDAVWASEVFGQYQDVQLMHTDLFGERFEGKFELMQSCRHHIIANSSYSWWGAWLRKMSPGVTIAPSRWFLGRNNKQEDLLPSDWIKI